MKTMKFYINFEDVIVRNAKNKRIAKKTGIITNVALYSGLGVLILTGTIGLPIVGNCIILGCVSKVTRIAIKKSGLLDLIGKKKKVDKIDIKLA